MSLGLKIAIVCLAVGALAGAAVIFPYATSLDFSNIRYGLRPTVSEDPQSAVASETASEEQFLAQRAVQLSRVRADQYLDSATRDYYQGSYEEALRRLDRAKWYDPANFEVFKLSGQIFFERHLYRRALNDWARASQLPNQDSTIRRDIDVLKRLIRYGRNEADHLRSHVNRNPKDQLAAARLSELEHQLTD